jgi:RNA polymerase sigma-70 factor (ECF subfamily)
MICLLTLINHSYILKSLNLHSDEELIERVTQDDEKAFESLFDRYWEKAHCIACSKLKSKEVAQEIVHDFFLNLWQRRNSLKIDNFSHYLQVAIKYKTITYINHQISRNKYLPEYQNQLQLHTDETLQRVEYNDLLKALEEGMKELPEKTQEVFRLSRMEGQSVSEIADQLNVSEKAIEYHITRSRKELRLYLKDFLVLAFVVSELL